LTFCGWDQLTAVEQQDEWKRGNEHFNSSAPRGLYSEMASILTWSVIFSVYVADPIAEVKLLICADLLIMNQFLGF
jgi:hypothetical protein